MSCKVHSSEWALTRCMYAENFSSFDGVNVHQALPAFENGVVPLEQLRQHRDAAGVSAEGPEGRELVLLVHYRDLVAHFSLESLHQGLVNVRV